MTPDYERGRQDALREVLAWTGGDPGYSPPGCACDRAPGTHWSPWCEGWLDGVGCVEAQVERMLQRGAR